MRRFTSWLAALAVLYACSSDAHGVNGPEERGLSTISISMTVSGDASAGLSEYPVFIDDERVGWIKPGETAQRYLTPGTHTISLTGSSVLGGGLSSWWCGLKGPDHFSVVAGAPRLSPLNFALACEPLIGEARMALTFDAPGAALGTRIGATVTRQNGDPYTQSFVAAPGIETVLLVPPGLYSVSVNSPSCDISATLAIAMSPPIVLRNSNSYTRVFSLRCN
jgi:hypothetical protein